MSPARVWERVQCGCLAPGLLSEEPEPLTAACYRKVGMCGTPSHGLQHLVTHLSGLSASNYCEFFREKTLQAGFRPWQPVHVLSTHAGPLLEKRAFLVPEMRVNEGRASGLRRGKKPSRVSFQG